MKSMNSTVARAGKMGKKNNKLHTYLGAASNFEVIVSGEFLYVNNFLLSVSS